MSSPSVPQVLDETPIALGVVVEEGHVVFDTNDTRQRIPVEEIIAIFPARIAVDAAAPRYILVHLHEDAASTDTPYRIASFVADTLPRELLDQHLVSSWPRHLHRDRDIHVVVSTGSGLGMASTFWTLALQPLLRFLLDKVYDADDDADDDADGGHDGYHLLVTKTAQCVKDFAKTRWAARPAAPLTTTTTTTTAASPRSETIILLSGDGGIVDLLNGTTSPSPPPGPRPSLVLRTFTISPDSAPLGRRLRVVRFGALGGERIMDIMKAAVTVREEDPRWRKVCVDGTIVEVPLGGSFEVRTVEGALFDVVVDPSIAGSP
ncbi:Phospho-2-dehydro-3-deoxyheptonate aldolase, tyrosine-inhibited [Verticillium dahliae VDG2]|nr:Phospho-2-dehydro-3-deoxyheptonate aldolase, tyrosine-inhibited [Verticillium dahliae VDG2]